MGEFFAPAHLIILALVGFLVILPFWKIFQKAGFPGALSLLLLLPFVNWVVLLWLAFGKWPSLNRNA